MRSPALSDLSSLAQAAQGAAPGLRALALRVGAQSFAAAPAGDAGAAARFEALALGLIPLVSSDVLAEVAALLRGVADTPAPVAQLLARRLDIAESDLAFDADLAKAGSAGLSGRDIGDLASLGRDDVDGALALNKAIALDGRALHALVERARSRRRLARLLLARPEPTVFDRAHLYAHADRDARERIRREIAVAPHAPPAVEIATGDAVRSAAATGCAEGLWAALASALGLPAEAVPLDEEAGQEVLALALRAAGLHADECLGALLRLDADLARSIPAIFHLADIIRTTSPGVARRLVGTPPALPGAWRQPPAGRIRSSDVRPADRVSARPLPVPARASGWSARAGHRSRSTIGRDRT